MTENARVLTAIALIALPVAFTVLYAVLGRIFAYPAILREPAAIVLERFAAGGTRLVLVWWAFAMTAIAFVPVTVAIGVIVPGALAQASVVVGLFAAVVQTLGLIRWPFLVPMLARERHRAPELVDLIFDVVNRYLGIAVGEHLGYLLTGSWTLLVALAVAPIAPAPFVIAGVLIGLALLFGALEFVGKNEQHGWKLAGTVVAISYTLWAAWLVAGGVLLLLSGTGR